MLATAPATAPVTFLAPIQAATLADPKVHQLQGMFPELDAEIIEAMLSFYNGDVERAAMAILDVPGEESTQQDMDESVARALQAEMDEQVARSVNDELQNELRAEAEAKRQQEPAVRAAKAVEKAAAGAKSFLQRALSARARGPTHGTRLLDGTVDPSDGNAPFDFTPLSVPAYVAPSVPTQPHISDRAQPYTQPYPLDSPQSSVAAMSEASSDRSSDRYSARLQRARTANQALQRGAPALVSSPLTSSPSTPPTATITATPHVPVGELI